MILNEQKGLKTANWYANEIFRDDDANYIGAEQYLNFSELLAVMAEQGIAIGDTPAFVLGGFQLIHSALLTSYLKAGIAVAFEGSYQTDSGWGFSANAGTPFAIWSPVDTAVAVDTGGAAARIDTVQIRPTKTNYKEMTRQFKNPGTGAITNSLTPTRTEFGFEFQVLKGVEGAGVAPAKTAGWIKVAEITVGIGASSISQSNIKDVRDSDGWTTAANSTKYKNVFIGEKVTSTPTGGTSSSLKKEDTIAAALTEIFTRLRNLSGVQNDAVINRHIGTGAVRQDEIDFGTDAGDVDADVLPLGTAITSSPTGGTASNLANSSFVRAALQEIFNRLIDLSGVANIAVKARHIDFSVDAGDVDADILPLGTAVTNSPTGGTATNLANSSFVRAALQEILNRLKDLSGVTNDAVDSRHYAADSVDDEHINWGSGANQIDLDDIPESATKKHLTTGTQTIAGVKTFSSVPLLPANTVEEADIQSGAVTNTKLGVAAVTQTTLTKGLGNAGSQLIVKLNGEWVVPAGWYMMAAVMPSSGLVQLRIFASGEWRLSGYSDTQWVGGMIISDGANVKITNGSGADVTVWYLQLA